MGKPGKTVLVRIKLSSGGKKLVRATGRVRATLEVTACLGSPKPKKVTRGITIRSPREKRMDVDEKGAKKAPAARRPAGAAGA